MVWLVGIDEAGYGPNLGPFVMTAVTCQVPKKIASTCLWETLSAAVRKGCHEDDDRILIDDSKVVYSVERGLQALERGMLATLWHAQRRKTLAHLLEQACPKDCAELRFEPWFTGQTALPTDEEEIDSSPLAERFRACCLSAGVAAWQVQSSVICAARFNRLLDHHGSKGAILAHSLACLLAWTLDSVPDQDELIFAIDKHGGRNSYAAQIQSALPDSMVVAHRESAAASVYEVLGRGRKITLTFQPRADQEHLCVSLASMASKYLRELLMREFNLFWLEHLPGLKATAGYPGDAARFYAAIQPIAARLGLAETTIWRRK